MGFERAELPAEAELWIGRDARGCILVRGRKVLLLVRTEHELCAYEDRCAHLGVPLSQGKLENGVITCAAHHYQYDARTGRGVNPGRTYALRVFPARGGCLLGTDIAVDVEGSP